MNSNDMEELRNGTRYHKRRHSGNTHADKSTGHIDEAATDKLMQDAAREIDRLRDVVRELRETEWLGVRKRITEKSFKVQTERLCKGPLESTGGT